MIYFFNRFANLSWKIDLCQMWLIVLLFLPLSSAVFTVPYGIQYNSVTKDDLKSECSLCYEDGYLERTYPTHIVSCTGPVLFVGAQRLATWFWPWEAKTMYVGAFALASAVQRTTALNAPHLSNGVYWYFTPGKSFGFLSDTDLHQEPAEDTGTTNWNARLSWNLDGNGGYRAGSFFSNHKPKQFGKFIYNCPNNF